MTNVVRIEMTMCWIKSRDGHLRSILQLICLGCSVLWIHWYCYYWEVGFCFRAWPSWLCNTVSPYDAMWRRWSWSTLVQAMACRLFGFELLPQTILPHCQPDNTGQTHGYIMGITTKKWNNIPDKLGNGSHEEKRLSSNTFLYFLLVVWHGVS